MKNPSSVLWFLSFLYILFSSHSIAQPYPPLRFLTEHSPPGEYLNEEGVVTGVTVELIRILQQRLDEPGEINILPWGRAMKIARQEKGLALFETVRTEERESWFKWVGPLQSYTVSLYGLKQRMINKPDLKMAPQKYIACTYRNSAIIDEIESLGFHTDRNLILTSKVGDCQKMVLLGRADLTPISDLGLDNFVSEASKIGDELVPVAFLTKRQRYLAFSLDVDSKRINRWQSALEQSYRDGTMRRLYQPVYSESIIKRLEEIAKNNVKNL
ncbi:MAG: transporter substrate-binding domain-containing protein [Paraglaciecola sp.]|uniref:substrate-binding periplasmic protein n=1 Tax=Paraglaciecola sp. TaxID=1920173 RepID=UPI003298C751